MRKLAVIVSLLAALATSSPAAYFTYDFAILNNVRLQNLSGAANQLPEGNVTANGVPYLIQQDLPFSNLNAWVAGGGGGFGEVSLVLSQSTFGVDRVYFLLNTFFGETSLGTLARIEFTGNAGAFFTKHLDGNVDIRDYIESSFTNSINGTTTTNAFSFGSGTGNAVRLDSVMVDLPVEFQSQTLSSIRIVDNGGSGIQRLLLSAVTLETADVGVPEPGTWILFSAGLAGVGLLRRRTN